MFSKESIFYIGYVWPSLVKERMDAAIKLVGVVKTRNEMT